MLLRQTRAEQVAAIWEDFVTKYPNTVSLGAASHDELFEQIKELGFGNQRVDALTLAASWLVEHHGGQVPETKEELNAIPHVGLYASHATLCFSFGKAVPVVDTNILRLFARILGKKVKRPDIRRNPWVWEIAAELTPKDGKRARLHNYGLLDFTAQICKPRVPVCEACPLSESCIYGSKRLRGESVTPPW